MYQTESAWEFNPEMANFEGENFEYGQSEWAAESGEVFGEAELMELTAELLEINNEQELNYFLGDLIKKAGRALGKVVRSPLGQAIGGVLKSAASKALPLAGAALGGVVGGPLGAQIGSGLAQAAGGALGIEGEALNQEDREYEGAKQFVRFAGETVNNALTAPASPNPQAAAQTAATQAAQALAPGLLGSAPAAPASRGSGGRWVRKGRNIIILNV